MKKRLGFLATVWLGLSTHKLRSFLTMLGIIIGVASVIVLMSIGKGTTAQILSNIQSMGADLITIRPGASFGPGGIRGAGGSTQTLTMEDAEAIAEQVPYVSAVAPYSSSNLQLVVGSENTNSQVTGTTPEYMQVNNLEIANGAFFTEYDYQRGSKVAVIGSDVKETLFGDADPIGQQMRMGSIIVRVTGVLESEGGGFNSLDDAVLIPLTALQQAVAQTRTAQGERVISSIALTVTDEEQADYVVEEITNLLRTRHRLAASDEDDFSIMSMEELASTLEETSGTLTLLLGAIAAISLLVGGIGVMNIMLVSVLERTREIGIRKALGARERDIWSQFLVEAAFLTFAGGLIGVAAGWAVSYFVSSMGLMTTLVTTDIVVLAISVS
ncbi:MAG: ABC transporter permease, partial [Dehalococcoidia bacterium]|nr:ABC transporter permease [Dehalococcoidia bacterium]